MCQTRLHTASSPNRPCRRCDIPSNRHVSSKRKGTDSVFAVQHDNKVGDVGADLETPPKAACRDAGGCGPGAVWESCDDEAGACFAAENEACFEDLEDGQAWFQQSGVLVGLWRSGVAFEHTPRSLKNSFRDSVEC